MTKQDEIPGDVWATAEKTFDLMLCNAGYGGARDDSIADLARAIMTAKAEERELAANIAKVYADEHAQMAVDALDLNKPLDLAVATQVSIVAGQIVFAIRNRCTV